MIIISYLKQYNCMEYLKPHNWVQIVNICKEYLNLYDCVL